MVPGTDPTPSWLGRRQGNHDIRSSTGDKDTLQDYKLCHCVKVSGSSGELTGSCNAKRQGSPRLYEGVQGGLCL